MFHNAALKLTFWYLVIVMALSVGCSIAIYHESSNDLARGAQRQVGFYNNFLGPNDFSGLQQMRQNQLGQDRSRLRGHLLEFPGRGRRHAPAPIQGRENRDAHRWTLPHHVCCRWGAGCNSPTGLSAYSLAAGGPILHPEVRNLVLTPISAHLSLRSPLVLPDTTVVRLVVHTDHEAGASFDGQSDIEMQIPNHAISVRVGPRVARFARTHERAYF